MRALLSWSPATAVSLSKPAIKWAIKRPFTSPVRGIRVSAYHQKVASGKLPGKDKPASGSGRKESSAGSMQSATSRHSSSAKPLASTKYWGKPLPATTGPALAAGWLHWARADDALQQSSSETAATVAVKRSVVIFMAVILFAVASDLLSTRRRLVHDPHDSESSLCPAL